MHLGWGRADVWEGQASPAGLTVAWAGREPLHLHGDVSCAMVKVGRRRDVRNAGVRTCADKRRIPYVYEKR
jgi:hypothetical protein